MSEAELVILFLLVAVGFMVAKGLDKLNAVLAELKRQKEGK